MRGESCQDCREGSDYIPEKQNSKKVKQVDTIGKQGKTFIKHDKMRNKDKKDALNLEGSWETVLASLPCLIDLGGTEKVCFGFLKLFLSITNHSQAIPGVVMATVETNSVAETRLSLQTGERLSSGGN